MHSERPSDTASPSDQRPRRPGYVVTLLAALLLCAIAAVATSGVLLSRARSARLATAPGPLPPVAEAQAGQATGGATDGDNSAIDPTRRPALVPSLGDLPGRLVYIDAKRQLATIRPDGGDQRQLTDDDRTYQFPAWAPDGSRVAVIGGDRSGAGVFVLPDLAQAGTPPEAIYFSRSESPFYLYWAPDSRQVSLLANHPSGLALYLAPAEGGATSLLATGQPFYWSWSPAGDEIFIHSGGSEDEARLALLDPTAEDVGDDIARPGSFQAPGISPSGQRWAYVEETADGQRRLIIRPRTGEPETRLSNTGTIALSWSPAEEKLAFIGPVDGGSQPYGPLRLHDAISGDTSILSARTVVAFFWSPDGQSIAYLTVHGRDTIEARAPQATPPKGRLARPLRQAEALPTLDLWVVDAGSGRERLLASLEPTTLFVSQLLPYFDQYALSHRVWSPDSRALVLPARVDGTSQIVVFSVDGRGATPLVSGSMAFWSHE